ncbi:hypothetical protein [Rhodoluna lacicola]|uniref:Uncharacterized protein n=1 Tax=Rhodoluna lacicola TaxID=529884 RepID=A0A060JDV0_9MICO|nr:hypothetical protein [Rhodoluna lacicola]AIC46945.1 hypothetical protein Rhola_00001150 [Rhodoluna lacicola]
MSTFNPDQIRSQTQIALPSDDQYLYRLGVALFGFSSVTNFMIEVTCYLDPTVSRTNLQERMSGEVLDAFRHSVKIGIKSWPQLKTVGVQTADDYEKVNTERSDFVHAYPITSATGQQILHRRQDNKGKYFEASDGFLDNFIRQLDRVCVGLYEIREIARPIQ